MEIYPAIDLFEGKVVRLERGDYTKKKVYSEDPAAFAQKWVSEGAGWLHVVDLEGARSGKIHNWEALVAIRARTSAAIEFGGGVRNREDVQKLFDNGINRVILGTKALDFAFLQSVTESHPQKMALSFDLRGEEVQVEGWLKSGGRSLSEMFECMAKLALDCVVITDIQRDGMLQGIDLKRTAGFLTRSPFPVILSGGVASLDDLRGLAKMNNPKLRGVIIGKALYEERFKLQEAIRLTRTQRKEKL